MSDNSTLVLRDYRNSDIASITQIYAHYVNNTVISFDLNAPDMSHMKDKFGAIRRARQPLIVATIDEQPVGYAYASAYRTRPAYRFTCENAIYLAPEHSGKGLGSALMKELLIRSKEFGFNQMIAVITDGDGAYAIQTEGSIALHKKFGFEVLGRFPELGYKFDTWHGIVHMQKKL